MQTASRSNRSGKCFTMLNSADLASIQHGVIKAIASDRREQF
jgi:hypothetical protein